MAQEILFTFRADDKNLGALLVEKRDQVRRLNAELKKAEEGTARYKELTVQLGKAKGEVTDLTKQQKALNDSFNNAKFPKGSLLDLRVEYGKLAKQIELLTEAERKSNFGQGLIKNAVNLKTQINGIEQSIGRFQGQVGNYKAAFGAIGDQLTGGLATGGVVAAVGAIAAVMKIGTDQALKYEQALADLSALTGLTGESLKGLENVATGLQNIQIKGVEIVNAGPEILNALKLVGGAQPELLQNAEALGEVTRQAIILDKASGDGLAPSVQALTTIMGQFNLTAKDTPRIIEELARGAKEGSAEIPQITDALARFGATAKLVNVSTSESIALIEILAKAKIPQDQIGVQIRNILTFIASAESLPPKAQAAFDKYGISAAKLADTTLPIVERFKELEKLKGDIPALKAIFGQENLQGAAVLSTQTAALTELLPKLTQQVGEESEALKQAAIRADTAANSIQNLKNSALNDLGNAFSVSAGPIKFFADTLGSVISRFGVVSATIKAFTLGPLIAQLEFASSLFDKIRGKPEKDLNPGVRNDPNNPFNPFETTDQQLKANRSAVSDANLASQQKQIAFLQAQKDAGIEAGDSISALTTQLRDLKNELKGETIGSDRFKELSAQIKITAKDLKAAKIDAGIIQPSRSGRAKSPEVEAAEGSINQLQKRVSDLNTKLQNAPKEQVKAILGDLVQAETDLKKANDQLELLKKNLKGAKDEQIQPGQAGLDLAQVQFAQARVDDLFAKRNDAPDPTELAAEIIDVSQQIIEAEEARRIAAVENNNLIVADEELTAEELLMARQGLSDRTNALADDDEEKAKKRREKNKEDLKAAALDVANGVGQFIIDSSRATLDAEQKLKEDALQTEYDRKIAAAQGSAVEEERIKKDFDKKKLALDKASAKERQNLAVKEALINTALAIIRALATGNFFAAGAAAILGALQVSAIKKQKFAKGGHERNVDQYSDLINRIGRPGGWTGASRRAPDETGERPVEAQLHEKEWVSPRWMVEHPVYGKDIGYLEKVRKRGYATGGFSSPPLQRGAINIPSESNPAQTQLSDAQMLTFARIVATETANAVREGSYQGTADGAIESQRLRERKAVMDKNRQA